MNAAYLIYAGVALIVIGFLAVFLGMLLSSGGGAKAEVRGGGVVFIGPIPIVFGTDKNSAAAVTVLAIILMLVFYLLFYRRIS